MDGTNAPANITTINFTNATASLVRGTNGTLIVVPVNGPLTAAGKEQVTFGAVAPTNNNGIVAPWVVAETSGT